MKTGPAKSCWPGGPITKPELRCAVRQTPPSAYPKPYVALLGDNA